MSESTFLKTIPSGDLQPDTNELAARLQVRRGYTDQAIETGVKNLLAAADCRYCGRRVSIRREGDTLDLGFGPIQSKNLAKKLEGCSEAFLFAVTAGIGIDRLLARLAMTSGAEHFIADAVGSALAEAACDRADAEIKGELRCAPRYSPGYGDLPLSIQPAFLEFLDARRLLGIHLNKSLLMTPMKSITAIMGIYDEQ
ncbi:MAG: hypothetical protein IJ333_06145 [Clostridia bacterium]|nr:hypothetical protein [Clostridia bacterium]